MTKVNKILINTSIKISKTTYYHLVVIFIFLIGIQENKAQQDTELWTAYGVDYNLNERFRLDLDQQVRFNQNISMFNYTYTELSLQYAFPKLIELTGRVRYTFVEPVNKRIPTFLYDRFRLTFDLEVLPEWFGPHFDFGYRLRYHDSFEPGTDRRFTFLRNYMSFQYKPDFFASPFIQVENFFRLNNQNEAFLNAYVVGIDWEITKKLEFTTYYKMHRKFVESPVKVQNIILTGLSYSIK